VVHGFIEWKKTFDAEAGQPVAHALFVPRVSLQCIPSGIRLAENVAAGISA
jgi:hypothetical protein